MAPGRNDAVLSMHHAVCTFLAVSNVCLLAGCGGDSTTPTQSTPAPVVTTVALSASLDTLFTAGATSQLTAVAQTSSGSPVSGKVFTWLSTDPSVAMVDNTGLVTAVGPNGSTTVSASTDGVIANRVIVVATGPQGGTVVAQSGAVTLDFPPGALTQPQSVTVTGPPAGLPDTDRIVSGAVFEFGPDGIVFDSPVQLTIEYAAANIPMGINEADLRLHKLEAGTWVEVASGTLDTQTKTVSGAIDGFSIYGVIGGGVAPGPVSPPLPIAVVRDEHSCALMTTHDVWCWGRNFSGVFGDGTQDDSHNIPVPAASGKQFKSLSLAIGSNRVCGIDLVGDAYCWGRANAATPQLVAAGMNFVVVDAGEDHVCALDANGSAFCWGENENGQLGDGTVIDRALPTAVSTNLLFREIGAGDDITCALHGSGKVYCWGSNNGGELGDGTNTERHTPVVVSGNQIFQQISVGHNHVCAVTASATAYCWGEGGEGELGDGSAANSNIPVAVSGGHSVVDINAGWGYTCLVDDLSNGWCWGEGGDGQLGTGVASGQLMPALMAGGVLWKSIATSEEHSCGVSIGDAFFCWGERFEGAIGDGTPRAYPSPVAVAGGQSFRAIDARGLTCGIDLTDAAHCWGGRIVGDGTQDARYVPTPVTGGLTFQSVSVGGGFACGTTTNNVVTCWGSSINRALGSGSQGDQLAPVPISSGLAFDAVAAGNRHACALTVASAVWCWGDAGNYQFGNGVQEFSDVPVAAANGLSFANLSMGEQSCAVTATQEGYCWGPSPTGSSDMTPTLVSNVLSFQALSAAAQGAHSCGVTTGNDAYCWGSNDYGQLGTGSLTPSSTPALVGGGLAFSLVSVGSFHTCGVTTTGVAYCWGDNGDGQLGTGTLGAQSLDPVPVSGGLTFTDLTVGSGWTCGITINDEAYCWGHAENVGNGKSGPAHSPVAVIFP